MNFFSSMLFWGHADQDVFNRLAIPVFKSQPITVSLNQGAGHPVLTENEIEGVSALFRQSFPDSFISQNGEEVVQLFINWLTRSEALCFSFSLNKHPDTGDIDGLCVTTKGHPIKQFVVENIRKLAPHVLAQPARAFRALRKQTLAAWQRTGDEMFGATEAKKTIWLLVLAVTPQHRGQGIADQLLAEAESNAAAAGYHQIALEVAADNGRAIAFYKRQGYQVPQVVTAPFLTMYKAIA